MQTRWNAAQQDFACQSTKARALQSHGFFDERSPTPSCAQWILDFVKEHDCVHEKKLIHVGSQSTGFKLLSPTPIRGDKQQGEVQSKLLRE
jgi:hypothetical protein